MPTLRRTTIYRIFWEFKLIYPYSLVGRLLGYRVIGSGARSYVESWIRTGLTISLGLVLVDQ